jgi:hypothetical protein
MCEPNPMTSTPRSLVLGFAASLPADSFRPFVTSLRATGYRGRFGLITAKCTPDQREQFRELADLHWDVDDQFLAQAASPRQIATLRWLRSQRGARRLYPKAFQVAARLTRERDQQARWERLEYELEGLQALRYRLYYAFLQDVAPDADVIMVSDLRDVLFQADPFDPPVDGLELFLEDPKSRLGTEPFNRRWLASLYGPGRMAAIADECTSCSGTTFGTRDAMLDYLTQMSHAIQWRRQPLGAHDQGVHNHLLRSGQFRNATIVQNGLGRVLTMGMLDDVGMAEDGSVLNGDGSLPPVLHQYDRHIDLAPQLLQRLAADGHG